MIDFDVILNKNRDFNFIFLPVLPKH